MGRKNYYDVINESDIDIGALYNRVYTLFYSDKIIVENKYHTMDSIVDAAFRGFPDCFKKGTISLEDFNRTFGFSFEDDEEDDDIDSLIGFCEYSYNLAQQLFQFFERKQLNCRPLSAQIDCLFSSIRYIIEDLGLVMKEKDSIIIFVEKSPSAEAVAEIVDDNLSYSVLEYNHFRLKGDLETKKTILKMMADDIEPDRKKLDSINKSLSNQLFQMMNKFVRHNVTDNTYLNSISDEDRENWYDEIYQLWLLAKLEIDNVERRQRVKDVLDKING